MAICQTLQPSMQIQYKNNAPTRRYSDSVLENEEMVWVGHRQHGLRANVLRSAVEVIKKIEAKQN